MWIVALHAVHAAFQYWMMLGQMKLSLEIQMTLEARLRFLSWIDDKSFESTQTGRGDMFAAGSVTGFAAALARHRGGFGVNPRMWAGGESSHDVRMTIRAGFVADEMRSGDFQRRNNLRRGGGARDNHQRGRGQKSQKPRRRQGSMHGS